MSMSQAIVSSSPSSDSQPDYDPMKVLAPDSVSPSDDNEEEESQDIIPPTQDAYDDPRYISTTSRLSDSKGSSLNSRDKPSALSGLNGKSLFGTSAPPSNSHSNAPSVQHWQPSGSQEEPNGLFQQIDEKQEDVEQKLEKLGTIVLSSDDSINSVAPDGKEATETNQNGKTVQADSEYPPVEANVGSEQSKEDSDAFSLRLTQVSDTQESVQEQSGESQTVLQPTLECAIPELEKEGSRMSDQDDEEVRDETEMLSKESDDNEDDAGLVIAGESVAKEGTSAGPERKRNRRLSRSQRARLIWKRRRAAREERAKKAAADGEDSSEFPPLKREKKRSRTKEADRLQAAEDQPGTSKRSLRDRRSGVVQQAAITSRTPREKGDRPPPAEGSSGSSESSAEKRRTSQRRIIPTRPKEIPEQKTPASSRRGGRQRTLRTGVPASEHHSTPRPRVEKGQMRRTQSERKAPPAKRRGRKVSDPYEIDAEDDFDASPAPLKHIHVARSFGDIRFSRAPSNENGATSKYARIEKSAELRRQSSPLSSSRERAQADTQPIEDFSSSPGFTPPENFRVITTEIETVELLSPGGQTVIKSMETDIKTHQKLTHAISPRHRRMMSPNKSTPSSGNLADVSSSLGSKSSSGSSNPRSTSSGSSGKGRRSGTAHVDDLSSNEGSRTMGKSSSSGNASASLFSEIEPMNEEEDNKETTVSWDEGQMETDATPERGRGRGRKRSRLQDDSDSGIARHRRRQTSSEDTGLLPKRPKPTYSVPELTPDEQLETDHPGPDTPPFQKGARVLAAWKDKNFYPGHIVESEGFGRFKVMFVDGALRDMPQPDIVPLGQLKTGDILMVDNTEAEELQPITIEKCPGKTADEWFQCIFDVYNDTTEQKQKVHWLKLVIDSAQRKHYVSTSVNVAAETVSAGNISGGRERRTRPSSFSPTAQSPRRSGGATPRKPGSSPRGRKPRQPPQPDTVEQPPSLEIAGVEAATEAEPTKLQKQIFEGVRFVLTSANRRTKNEWGSDSEEERPPIVFVKKDVRRMIEERGGTVIDDFSKVTKPENVFLVADTHYRTHKYLSALARAIPCVSHIWIHNCCTSDERQDPKNYMLPAGISLERQQLMDWHDECPRLLKGMTVMVHTENRPPPNRASLDFVQIWAPLVRCMGATVVNELPEEGGSLGMLLTDASCTEEFLDRARSLGSFAVSSEWLIQAIITGERPGPDSHQKYNYDYVEPLASSSSQ